MATQPIKAGAVTMVDFLKSIDPDGKTAAVIELLNQNNDALQDITWKEGNLPTGHQSTIRTGLPVPTWRKMYGGVPPSKSTRAQVTDACGMLSARTEVDVKLAALNGNTSAFRMSEAAAEMEGMQQNFLEALFYGDQDVNPERITGLTPRYNSLTAGNAQNIIDCGGTGSNNASIWLVGWGEGKVTGIYPKAGELGLKHKDLGEIDAFDANQSRFRAYADLWEWDCGLAVQDWRYAVRACNINMADLIAQSGTQAPTAATAIIKVMVRMMARIPQGGNTRFAFYANRTVKEFLSVAALDKSNATLAIQPAINQFGNVAPGSLGSGGTLSFLGVPIRTVDRLLSTEARVV